MINYPVIGYVFRSALRDRLIASMLCTLVAGLSLSIFMGSSAINESDQFSYVFASSALRFIGVVGIVLFTVFYVRRMYDRKDIDYMLSRPISRLGFIVSHALAFIGIASIVAVVIGGAIAVMTMSSENADILQWCLGLWVEFIIVATAAMFFSMVLSSPAAGTLATIGLYVLGRMMGNLLGVIDSGVDIAGFSFLSVVMQVVSLIVPRFDLLVQSGWLVYGEATLSLLFMVGHSTSLVVLFTVAAWIDLQRKQF